MPARPNPHRGGRIEFARREPGDQLGRLVVGLLEGCDHVHGSALDEHLDGLGTDTIELHGVGGALTLERLLERLEAGAIDEGACRDSQRTEVLLTPCGAAPGFDIVNLMDDDQCCYCSCSLTPSATSSLTASKQSCGTARVICASLARLEALIRV